MLMTVAAISGLLRSRIRVLLVALCVACVAVRGYSAPRTLLPEPLRSPDRQFAANVQWDDAGFVGVLSMQVFSGSGKLLRTVEVPEINPSPANLLWLDDEWVACDSFIGHNGSGFFYVHAPTGKGYLLEIVAPSPDTDWIFSAASNDPISSGTVSNISRGRMSLFPIQLRNVPDREAAFFSAEFVREVTVAIETYNAYRKQRGIRHVEILSDADIRTQYGAIFVAQVDGRAEVVYFPAGAETPVEMFNRVKRYPLPANIQAMLKQSPPPDLRARWLKDGEFVVESFTLPAGPVSSAASTPVAKGRLENVTDKPFNRETTSTLGTTGTLTRGETPDFGEDDDEPVESGPGDPEGEAIPNFYGDAPSTSPARKE